MSWISPSCVLLHTWQEGRSKIRFLREARVGWEAGTIFTKITLFGFFMIFIGTACSPSNFQALNVSCDRNRNTTCWSFKGFPSGAQASADQGEIVWNLTGRAGNSTQKTYILVSGQQKEAPNVDIFTYWIPGTVEQHWQKALKVKHQQSLLLQDVAWFYVVKLLWIAWIWNQGSVNSQGM